jgi:hypothetical protein
MVASACLRAQQRLLLSSKDLLATFVSSGKFGAGPVSSWCEAWSAPAL